MKKLKILGAGNQIRTHDLLHGKQMLYQLSYTRIREEADLRDFGRFGKRILALEIVDHHAFAAGFEDFFHKVHVQRVLLIGVLRGFVLKHEVQCNLVGLINHITVAFSHFAAMIVHYARAGLEIFFSSGEQFFGGIRYIRFGPENDYVGKHCLGW